MKRPIKVLCLILAVLMIIPFAVSCGESGGGNGGSVDNAPDAPDLPAPETLGYEGSEFNILVAGNYTCNDFAAEGETGTVVQTAVYRRNQYIESKYGVTVTNEDIQEFGSSGGSGKGYKAVYQAYMAGEALYDAALVGTYDVASLAYSGYLHDMNDVPYLNLTHDYWDARANADLAVNGVMYYSTGDITTIDNMVTHALLFNKEMIKDYNLDNPYSLVESGDWTLENFMRLVKSVGDDLNSDGVYDENDRYGLLTWNDSMLAVLASGGAKIATVDANGQITLSLYTESVVNLYDEFTSLVFDETHAFNYQYNRESATWDKNRIAMFNNDQALFYMTVLTTVAKHRDSETDFGILPYPKATKEQENYGQMVSAYHCAFMCVPEMAADFEKTGIMLEELAYKGKELLTPAYYDTTLVGQYCRDEESAEMLDIIFANRVYDVGIYYKIGGYKDSLVKMFSNRTTNLASLYETSKTSAENMVEQVNAKFAQVYALRGSSTTAAE